MRYSVCTAALLVLGLHCVGDGPMPPTVTGPSSSKVAERVEFALRTEDPRNRDVCFKVSWGDGTVDDWTDAVHSGTGAALRHTFQRRGAFTILARARNANGVMSEWSAPFAMAVTSPAPSAPTAPAGPATGLPGRMLVFSASALDPDEDSVSLRFDWGDGVLSEWSSLVESGEAVADSNTYADTGTFSIRAQAKDALGDTSDWSASATLAVTAAGWQTVMSEGFEFSFPTGGWSLTGSPTWGRDTYRYYQLNAACWCAGSSIRAPGPYPNNMDAAMIYGPFSLEGATDAYLVFQRHVSTEQSYDYLSWKVSVDSQNFYGDSTSGYATWWQKESLDLKRVPTLGNVCGRPKVWVAFGFTSDYSNTGEGAYVDNVLLRRYLGGDAPPRGGGGLPCTRPNGLPREGAGMPQSTAPRVGADDRRQR